MLSNGQPWPSRPRPEPRCARLAVRVPETPLSLPRQRIPPPREAGYPPSEGLHTVQGERSQRLRGNGWNRRSNKFRRPRQRMPPPREAECPHSEGLRTVQAIRCQQPRGAKLTGSNGNKPTSNDTSTCGKEMVSASPSMRATLRLDRRTTSTPPKGQ